MDSRDTSQRRTGRRQSLRSSDGTKAATGAIITPRVHPFRNTPQTRPHRKQPPVGHVVWGDVSGVYTEAGNWRRVGGSVVFVHVYHRECGTRK